MEVKYDCKYAYEDIKKCNWCNRYIEFTFNKVYRNNKIYYYHTPCYALMFRYLQKYGSLYSC